MVDTDKIGLLDSIIHVARSLTNELNNLTSQKRQNMENNQGEISLTGIYSLINTVKNSVMAETIDVSPNNGVLDIIEEKLDHSENLDRTRLNYDITTVSYDALCIEAGGIKGIYFLGALHELTIQNPKIFSKTSYYIGFSIGSVICYLLCIGYEPIEFFTTICHSSFTSRFTEVNFLNLPRIFGFFPTCIIKEKLHELTMIKLGYIPTFKDLLEKFGKNLIVPVYKLSAKLPSQRKMFFSVDNAPDMIALDAVVLSCSLPIIFQRSLYKSDVYIDGAYTANLPLKHIHDILDPEMKILALAVESNNGKKDSFIGYLTDLLYIPLREQDNIPLSDRCDIIDLRTDVIASSINFSVPTTKKIETFISGMKQIRGLMRKKKLESALSLIVSNINDPIRPIASNESKETETRIKTE